MPKSKNKKKKKTEKGDNKKPSQTNVEKKRDGDDEIDALFAKRKRKVFVLLCHPLRIVESSGFHSTSETAKTRGRGSSSLIISER